ncbi:MAG: RNA 2',3'-cyclic phosphodiesterase [Paenibacillaceae bacterium]
MKHIKTHLFMAVPIPDSIKLQLNVWCLQIQKHISFKRWVFPSDYHITLKFLGGVDNDTLVRLKPLIGEVTSKQCSFSLALERLNTFGKSESPRILWTSVKGDLNPLFILQKNIDESTKSLGFVSENRPYVPHLTLAKNYTGKATFETIYLEQAVNDLPMPLKWEVNEIVLYQTHLGREPMYEPLEAFSLYH